MQENRAARVPAPLNQTHENPSRLIALPATPSFSLADANTIVDIEIQADQLLDYINKLTSLADRACSTVLRQTETARLIENNRHSEVSNLRTQLDQQNAQFREQQLAMVRLEEGAMARIAALESQLRQVQNQRSEEQEIRKLRGENAALINRLSEAQEFAKQAQARISADLTPLDQEVNELRLQLANRDKTIESKNSVIKTMELDNRAKSGELEKRLRDSETKLLEQESTLKDKDALIRATAAKEVEIGKLIARLSAECDRLNAELQEKNRIIAQLEPKKAPSIADSTIWRQVMGRFQEESS